MKRIIVVLTVMALLLAGLSGCSSKGAIDQKSIYNINDDNIVIRLGMKKEQVDKLIAPDPVDDFSRELNDRAMARNTDWWANEGEMESYTDESSGRTGKVYYRNSEVVVIVFSNDQWATFGGITRGSTREDVEKVYGATQSLSSSSEFGYYGYNINNTAAANPYECDYSVSMEYSDDIVTSIRIDYISKK